MKNTYVVVDQNNNWLFYGEADSFKDAHDQAVENSRSDESVDTTAEKYVFLVSKERTYKH